MEELYESLYNTHVTILSNEFLTQYLSDTKPEYLKIFIFYLWKGIREHYTVSDASNEIDLDEEVVEMGLKYWIRKKLIKKECLIKNKIEPKIANTNDTTTQKKSESIERKKRVEYEEIEKDLLFVAEKLLGQALSGKQTEIICKCYNEYAFDEALIQYLIEYCANNNKKNSKYIDTVAESWYEQGIKTIEEAKAYVENFDKNNTKKVKIKKTNNNRALDRKIDYNKIFLDSTVGQKNIG